VRAHFPPAAELESYGARLGRLAEAFTARVLDGPDLAEDGVPA
jgi:hypothetical protein